jgi:hypothetical protein
MRAPPLLVAGLLAAAIPRRIATAQQVPDTLFAAPIAKPAFAIGTGPVVAIDAGHANFHTIDGRYAPFARLLTRDGYRLRGASGPFTRPALGAIRVLVVANALDSANARTPWRRPIRSAFADSEIDAVERWVRDGGALLLVADHMPFAGAALALARRFGVVMYDGFAVDTTVPNALVSPGPDLVYRRAAPAGAVRLLPHAITTGVDSVVTFMGSAFRVVPHDGVRATPLLALASSVSVLLPDTAWMFTDHTPRVGAEGLLQGVALEVGRGRVVVLGEAAMFTAQRQGTPARLMGFNAPRAAGNVALLRNTIRWLAR